MSGWVEEGEGEMKGLRFWVGLTEEKDISGIELCELWVVVFFCGC